MAYEKRVGKATLELSLESSGFQRSLDRIKRDGFGGLAKEVEAFTRRHRASFMAIGQAAGLVTAGLGAATAAVVSLGQRGAVVADVASQFDALAKNVGSTGSAMLGALQRGTLGSIRNFELMRLSNTALGSGLVRTAADMEALAGGARLLAKRTGGDTAEAFDTLTSAIASGRTATLKQLGLFVDSKAAIEAYAKAHKMAAADMTDADRAAALQAATIAALRQQFAVTALDAADFGERIDQLKVRWQNFSDDLAVAISMSPVLNEALRTVSDGLASAFGEDQSERIKQLTKLVNDFVLALTHVGQFAVIVADIARRAWGGLQLVFSSVMSVLSAGLSVLAKLQASALELAAKLPLVGRGLQDIAYKARDAANFMAGVQESFHQQSQEALAATRGQSAFHQVLSRVSTGLSDMRGRMLLVASHTQSTTAATAALTTGLNTQTESLARNTTATQKNADAKARQAAEYRAFQNFIGEREIEDVQRARDAANAHVQAATDAQLEELENEKRVQEQIREEQDRADADWRSHRNEIGERMMEDEARRLQQLQELRERALAPWRDLRDRLSGAASTNLLGLFTGVGGDAEAKQRAKDAREDYERLAAAGRASAEEITRAFRAMRDAEDAAQSRFSDRFKAWLGGLRNAFTSWVNDLAGAWTKKFIGGLLNSLATSALGQRVSGWLGIISGEPGVGGGGLSGLGGLITKLGSQIAGGFKALGGLLANPGLWTNPWTIGIALGAAAAPLIAKGISNVFGAGQGGRLRMEAWARGDRTGAGASDYLGRIHRDTFLAVRNRETRHTGGVIGEKAAQAQALYAQNFGDLKPNEVIVKLLKGEAVLTREATAALGGKRIVDLINSGGLAPLFKSSGFAPPMMPRPLATAALDRALTVPSSFGSSTSSEMATASLQRMTGGGASAAVAPRHTTINIEIKALDGADVEKVVREKVAPKLRFMIATDQDGMGTAVQNRALR